MKQNKESLSSAISEEEMDFNFSSYDLEETPIEAAIEDAETFPFMGERRVYCSPKSSIS